MFNTKENSKPENATMSEDNEIALMPNPFHPPIAKLSTQAKTDKRARTKKNLTLKKDFIIAYH